MNAEATYNETGDVIAIDVDARKKVGLEVGFAMEGSTAVCVEAETRGSSTVFMDNVNLVMEYVESLPFVQAVTLDEYTEEQQ